MAPCSEPGALVGATGSGKHHKRLASDPPGIKPSIREYQARILARRLRRQRLVEHLHRLGPSPLFHFFAEIERGASNSDRHKQEWAKRDLWHGALIKISRQKGYKPGWAAHKFREKFGVWPTLNYPPEREPTVEILNWVKSRNIAYAKAMARG